jgi:hypothetical protein
MVEIGIVVGEFQWLMYMFRARVPLYICFGGQSAYVFVVLGPECLCNLFRLECMCDFGSRAYMLINGQGAEIIK